MLLYAFRTTRGHINLEFKSQQESINIEKTWQLQFVGSGTICSTIRTNQKLFSVLIKDVPKDPEFSDENLTQWLTKDFSGANAQNFIKRDKTILNTIKADMPKQRDLEIVLQNGLFLNNQFLRAYEFNQEERKPRIRCYNCQGFGHIAKPCNSLPKCRKCSETNATNEGKEQAEKNYANCQLNHFRNDTNCQTELAYVTKVYNQRKYPNQVSCKKRPILRYGITKTDGNKIAILHLNVTGLSVSCCEINSFQRTTFDSVWWLVHVQNLSFILSTAYVPPNAEEEFGDFILSLDEARHYSVAIILSGIILVGDFNAGRSFWEDTRSNKCGDFLEAYIEEANALLVWNIGEPTFYAVSGNSVIDMTIITDKLTDLCYTQNTDTETKLLTVYSSRGHVPVFSVFKFPNSSAIHIQMKYYLGKTDWKEWKTILEENMIKWVNPQASMNND